MTTVRDEAGATPAELALGLAVLVLPVALLVLSLPVWAATQNGARAAVREAARVAATAPDDASGRSLGTAMALDVAGNHGVEVVTAPRFTGSVEGPAGQPAEVTAALAVRLPVLRLPFLGDVAAVDWEVEHTEPVDPYRSRP